MLFSFFLNSAAIAHGSLGTQRQSRRPAIWQYVLLGTMVGMPWVGTAAIAQATPQATPSEPTPEATAQIIAQRNTSRPMAVGVVRGADNLDHWENIVQRFEAAEIPFTTVDQEAIARDTNLSDFQVLVLPNIETFTSEQIIAIGTWLNNGGRLIVSGPTGTQSSHGVQQALQSILGATWSVPLPEPAQLVSNQVRHEAWTELAPTDNAILGGVVIPSGITSEVLLTWDGVSAPDTSINQGVRYGGLSYGDAPAVVTTGRTTFLGWYWGTSVNSAAFDTAWLQAAIQRYGTLDQLVDPVEAAPAIAQRQIPAPVPAPVPAPSASSPRETPQSDRSPTSPSQPRTPAAALALPTAPAETRPAPTAVRPTLPSPPANAPTDPADAVAPAGIEVELNDLPIIPMQANAMRRDLEELMGRFESALLLSMSTRNTDDFWAIAMPESTLVASAERSQSLGEGDRPTTLSHPTLDRAHQMLDEFEQLVEEGAYAAARQQWHNTRQLLWEEFPSDRPIAQTEIRAIWLDRGSIVQAGSREGLASIFDRLQAAGINTVFFETVNAGYTIYPSQVAPAQNPLTEHWDPLAAAVELAHERDMELHAWVWTFAAGNQRHNALLNQPASYPGPLITAHPTWANYDNRGSMIPIGQEKPFLDPANPEVRRYLLQLFEEIVTQYDVDGLQLDYIRYPFQDPSAERTYGYGTAARQQFEQLTGVDPTDISPSDRDLWEQWTTFRTEQVNSFVAETDELLHRLDPNLILSTAVFAISEHERIHKIQQHWEVWAERGDVDMIVTMSYALDTNRLQQLVEPWLTDASLNATLVVPSIRLLNLSESATLDQIQALRDLPSGGFSMFAAENLRGTLHTTLTQTQGMGDRLGESIPYRDPFGAALERYDTLQREWSVLLESNQLWLADEPLTDWRSQAETLNRSLEQLANRPSPARLQAAQRSLETFRANFGTWSARQAIIDPYRVETWENRLAVLDGLLSYGERTLAGQPQNTAQTP